MIARVAAMDGGMTALQREAVKLLIKAFDEQESAASYVSERLCWHVGQARAPATTIDADEVLMPLITHKSEPIRAQAVRGLGVEAVLGDANACDARGVHLTAAKLAFSACAGKGNAAAFEGERVWESLKKLSPSEVTTEALTLEMNALMCIVISTNSNQQRDSTSNQDVVARMTELGQLLTEGTQAGATATGSDDAMQAEIGLSIVEAMKSWAIEGLQDYAVATPEVVTESHGNFRKTVQHLHNAAAAAPNEAGRNTCLNLAMFFALDYSRKLTDNYDLPYFYGEGGKWLRDLVDSYDYERDHPIAKTIGFKTDLACVGSVEQALLLHYGDLAVARRGWDNSMATFKRIDKIIASGESTVDGYTYEIWNGALLFTNAPPSGLHACAHYHYSLPASAAAHHLINGALLAGDIELVRSFMKLSLVQLLLTDTTTLSGFWAQWGAWETNGHVHSTRATWLLIIKSVGSMLEEATETSDAALRDWLPPVPELLCIAEFHDAYRTHAYGQMHPSLLCAELHGSRLGDWQVAVTVATRLLELQPAADGEAINPLLRVAALRLLCKANWKLGQREEACTAAERAADTAANAQCWWLEMLAMRDLLRVRGDGENCVSEEVARAEATRLVRVTGRLAASAEELAAVLGDDVVAVWEEARALM